MIDADVRNVIYQLHLAGTPLRDISRQFHVSRNTVRQIVRQQGALPQTVRKDKIQIDGSCCGGSTTGRSLHQGDCTKMAETGSPEEG